MPCRFLASLTIFALAGCAENQGAYPSLAPRAIEAKGFAEPEAPAPVPVAPDPALDATIAVSRAKLTEAAARFDAAATRAERLAAAAKRDSAGSDRWLDAQTALADLDGLRAEGADLLSTLETAAIDRATTLAPPYPALDEAIEAARAQQLDQAARIAAIGRSLAPA